MPDREYLRILHLAATTLESRVERPSRSCSGRGLWRTRIQVNALVAPEKAEVPNLALENANLNEYDTLLASEEVAS